MFINSKRCYLLLCLVILFFPTLCGFIYSQSKQPKFAVVYLHGEVDFSLSSFVKRALKLCKDNGITTIIFDIDTFGGRVDSALEISNNILMLNNIHTVSYVSVKAISAGALIALSSKEIVMRENTTLGDVAPLTLTPEGPVMLGEKFQSPLRAEFRKLAQKNGFPEILAEAMVSEDIEALRVIYKDGSVKYISKSRYDELTDTERNAVYKKETVVKKGELLTVSDKEALDFGFASKIVKNEDDLFVFLNIDPQNLLRVRLSWSERLVKFIDKIAPVLFAIGLLALYTEFKVPGFGLPGIIGIVCFALIFGSKFFVGLAQYYEILIFVGGVLLIILEIFVVPGFGVTGITGILLVLFSLYLVSQPFVIPYYPWESQSAQNWAVQFGLAFLAFLAIAFLLAFFLPRSPIAKKIGLSTTLSASAGFKSRTSDYNNLIGKEGISESILRPAGKARIDDILYDVVSETDFIKKDVLIRVVKIEGNNIIVREA